MYFSKWKDFCIIFLIILAIYQTVGLWFENFSIHSFFYTINNKSDNINIQNDTMYLTESILINIGDNVFVRKYNNISNTDYKEIFDQAIYYALKEGKYNYVEKFDINQIINSKTVVYTYDFYIKGQDIPSLFNVSNSNLADINSFNNIVIAPSVDTKLDTKVIFLSTDTLEAYEVNLSKAELTENIVTIINNFVSLNNKNFYYISSQGSGISLFSSNQYLPKAKEDFLSIENIVATNPLEQDGGILLSSSESYVDVFFDNSFVKTSSFTNNTYTYSDENIIVKYYPNGVLEYVKYVSTTSGGYDKTPYNIAIDFIKKDTNIKNEYYLTDYTIDNEKSIFYFNYKINDFPIILSEQQKEQTQMESMIEVVVENGMVSKYKRLVYDFTLDYSYTNVENSFIQAIDNFLVNNENSNTNIDEMELIYSFQNIYEPLYLSWYIKYDDKEYVENVAYGG